MGVRIPERTGHCVQQVLGIPREDHHETHGALLQEPVVSCHPGPRAGEAFKRQAHLGDRRLQHPQGQLTEHAYLPMPSHREG